MSCPAIIESGPRSGEICGKPGKPGKKYKPFCGNHSALYVNALDKKVDNITKTLNKNVKEGCERFDKLEQKLDNHDKKLEQHDNLFLAFANHLKPLLTTSFRGVKTIYNLLTSSSQNKQENHRLKKLPIYSSHDIRTTNYIDHCNNQRQQKLLEYRNKLDEKKEEVEIVIIDDEDIPKLELIDNLTENYIDEYVNTTISQIDNEILHQNKLQIFNNLKSRFQLFLNSDTNIDIKCKINKSLMYLDKLYFILTVSKE